MAEYSEISGLLSTVVLGKPHPEGINLAEILQRLDLAGRNSVLPDQLRHYLERRSYAKALAWIKDPNLQHHP